MDLTAKFLAQLLKGTVEGDENAKATKFAKIEHGKPGSISFFANPKYSFEHRGNNNLDSRAWTIDSKYVRLKNVEIGYTFNKPRWIPLFNYVRFYASGQNLLTFANFKGNDPEAPGQGLDFGVRYPMTRVYNFGVQVNF